MDQTRLAELLGEQDGIVSRAQVPPALLEKVLWQVRSGRWQRLHPGLFVSHSGPLSKSQRLWAAVVSGGPEAALCGPTAAALGGLVGLESTLLHVAIPRRREGAAIAGVRFHRMRDYESTIAPLRRPRRVALPHALGAMAADAATDQRAHHILASAVQQRLVRTADLRDAVATKPTLHRRAVILETLVDIDDGAQSMNEIAMLRLAKRYGLPPPATQITTATKRRHSHVDGGWPAFGVLFEIDGAGHFEIGKWLDDADRQNEIALVRQGMTLLRWPGFLVRRRPDVVADQARRALRAAGWVGR